MSSCSIGLTESSQKKGVTYYKATSNCDYLEKFNLKSAETSTKSMPCTNRPINCPKPGCNAVVWTYNLYEHFKSDHTEKEYDDAFSITDKERSLVRANK